jgi:hypothetical protein
VVLLLRVVFAPRCVPVHRCGPYAHSPRAFARLNFGPVHRNFPLNRSRNTTRPRFSLAPPLFFPPRAVTATLTPSGGSARRAVGVRS